MRRNRSLGPLVVAYLSVASTAFAGGVTMDQLWPGEDGRRWVYDQRYQEFGLVPQVIDTRIRLVFDGPAIAPTAIVAQYLRQELIEGPAPMAALASSIADPLLRDLWTARPDLRARIAEVASGSQCPENAPPAAYATLLGGEFAFRKTALEVAAWRCNLADTRSWLWLESNLTLGSEFTLQLVPDLANDVFLHGTVAAIEDVQVPAGSFTGCVRVDYRIDYGTSVCQDEFGDPVGTYRSEKRGSVYYAPDEGPVESIEEFVPVAETTGDCGLPWLLGQVLTRTTLRLASPSVPVRAASWGSLKSIYR